MLFLTNTNTLKNEEITFVLIGIVVAMMSCSKSEDDEPQNEVVEEIPTNFFPLEVGNRWIYQTYRADSFDINFTKYCIDTLEITGDSVINGSTFYHLEGRKYGIIPVDMYLGTDQSFLISGKGEKRFSVVDDGTLLYDSVTPRSNQIDKFFVTRAQMVNMFDTSSIGLGSFETITTQKSLFLGDDNFTNGHPLDQIYARNVGPIIFTGALISSILPYYKMELIDYDFVN